MLANAWRTGSTLRYVRIKSSACSRLTPVRAAPRLVHIRSLGSSETSGATESNRKSVSNKYTSTVLLPSTPFDQRANAVTREPEMQQWWEEQGIFQLQKDSNSGPNFILHDGPPYANGNLHIGHALNKILKDFVCRYKILKGHKVHYRPGWDCHGLPIEMKVLQELKSSDKETLTPILLRKRAAKFAEDAMKVQRESFKRYGVWGDWSTPYLTMQKEYEAAQIRVFGDMVAKGHVYRGKKPVHWSPSSRTALAEAELEYPENYTSRSVYLAFRATKVSDKLKTLAHGNDDIRVAIWTTTPWTIPANLAVAVNNDIEYCLASHPNVLSGAKVLVAKDLVAQFSQKIGIGADQSWEISECITGAHLVGTEYKHPLYDRIGKIVIGGDYITTETGTGLVHTAPGHGLEDFLVGQQHNLGTLSPVNDHGQFTDEAGAEFAGLSVLKEGNEAVINALTKEGALLVEEAYNHKYPHDWRTKKPTIVRVTEQWFASISNFREAALNAIAEVKWIPAAGRNRIHGMVESRGDWCISRQRAWGVPIPVFYRISDNEILMNEETLSHIEKIFREHGSDSWWEMSVEQLLPEGPLRNMAHLYTKGTDTMDVWFDSGTSWAGVLRENGPADMYLEGSDQHRGWFQSSLLTSVATTGKAPFKSVLTHGFVLDEKGYKMSKSLGNVVDPHTVINGGKNVKEEPPFGADTLRLWVSGVDYAADVCIGKNIMKQVSESGRKLRNTLRFLLGSLHQFEPSLHSVAYEELPSFDKHILGKLTAMVNEIESSYEQYQFQRVNHLALQFMAELSAFYLDVAKDRLYISGTDEFRRRSCQTVLSKILEQVSVSIAPIVPHLAEEVWRSIPYRTPTKSIFLRGWVCPEEKYSPFDDETWATIGTLRNDVNRCIESARKNKLIGASMECQVFLHTSNSTMEKLLKDMTHGDHLSGDVRNSGNGVDDLRFVWMVSGVTLCGSLEEIEKHCPLYNTLSLPSGSGVTIGVAKADGLKCERCWYYSSSVGSDQAHPHICSRCRNVVRNHYSHIEM